MKVITRCVLQEGKDKKIPPKTVVDLDKNEAIRLIRMRLAVPFDTVKEIAGLIPPDGDEGIDEETPSLEKVIKDLERVPGIDKSLAAGLYNEGIYSVEEVAVMRSTEILASFEGITKKAAREIITSAKVIVGKK